VVCLAFGLRPAPAGAQQADAVGVRAQGMAGAFTAVADDASASWWNPAGLAGGAYFNLLVEYGEATDAPASDTAGHRGLAVAFPALGLSYYRLPVSEIQSVAATGAGDAGRQDQRILSVRSLAVSQFGATVGQSIGSHLVVASTVKLLRAGGESRGGLDLGMMTMYRTLKAGITLRNARQATFGSGDAAVTLRRQVRAGVALSSAANTAYGGATVAFDADLRRVATALGDERRIGAGGEVWTRRRSLGARGGIGASTVGDRRTTYSGGVSVAVRPGVMAEGQLTGGSDATRKGWSAGFRVTF
jgi:hypothetical protein